MKSRTLSILTWIPAYLVGIFLILASGLAKLFMIASGSPMAQEMFSSMGGTTFFIVVGLIEILCGVLLMIPRTFTIGFVLTVGLLGGAMATGLTNVMPGNWPWFPLVLIAILSISAWFKSPELLDRLLGKPVPKNA